MNFADKLIDFFEEIHPLDRVPRAGFLLRGVAEPESVAAHSHFMALMALLFLENHPGEYDRERVYAMTLLHDLSEARIMDIPMPFGDAYLSDAKQVMEQAVVDDLLEDVAPELSALHAEYVAGTTPEARLVRGLDKVQMMIKVLCYEREKRGNLTEFWENPKNFADYGIEAVSELFEAICARAGRTRPLVT